VKCCEVDEARKPVAGTEFFIRADLVSSPSAFQVRSPTDSSAISATG
jgi:glutamate synthase (NADPH/NADH) small chain